MTRLRVLHVIPSMSPLRGGPTYCVHDYVGALSRRGIDVDVVTTDDEIDGPSSAPLSIAGSSQALSFPRTAAFYSCSLRLWLWLMRHVGEYDLVHVHAVFSFPSLAAAFWAKVRGVSYIVQPHGILNRWGMENRRSLLKRASFLLIERHMLRRAARVLFNTAQEQAEAMRLLPLNHGVVIPLCLDLDRPLSRGNREALDRRWPRIRGKRIVLFLSRIDRKKGLDLLLDAFSRIPDRQGSVLMIAGTGDAVWEEELKSKAASLDISGRIVWTGFLAGQDKWDVLGAADVFTLPSFSESFGLSVVEAMAAGTPIVVTDQVALCGDLTAARAGLVTRCDPDEIARALTVLLDDANLRAKLAENATALLRSRFSAPVVGAALAMAYFESVAEQPAPIRASAARP